MDPKELSDNSGDEDLDESLDDDANETDGEPEARFTQADFDKAMTTVRKKARSAATRKFLEELGVDDVEQAKALVQTARAKGDESESSDAEALREENKRLKQEAVKREVTGRVKDALVEAGVTAKAAAKAAKLLDFENKNPSDEEIEDEISELKDSMPALFVAPAGDKEDDEEEEPAPPSRGSTTPPRPKPKRKGTNASDRAREILAQRHPQTAK